MATTTRLEDLYRITENSYTTGSEWLDGLLIGLATLLLIRNGEFVMLDILTFFFGDRRNRVAFSISKPLPLRWMTNGFLRMEEILLTPERAKRAGGIVTEAKQVFCRDQNSNDASSSTRFYSHEMNRQFGFQDSPNADAEFTNNLEVGEIQIRGHSIKSVDGRFFTGSAAVLPVFSDAQRTLRLAFSNFYAQGVGYIGGRAPTINGKLLFSTTRGNPGSHMINICPDALDEIIRVTGTLHPGLITDLFRSSMTVHARQNFTEPSPSLHFLNTVRGFEIGTSRKFRIQPEWMIVAAALTIIVSSMTSRLNRTDLRIARVYREHNNMWSASLPAFLDEENAVEGALFRNENEYHWGERPGKEWEELSKFEFSADAILV